MTGQKVGETPLTDQQLDSTGPAYLWYYLLKEAELLGESRHLGPVGTRIVAETLVELTKHRSALLPIGLP
ncbi:MULTISPECIES: ovoperoxidase [Frankia]|uniref:Ovoperoxidase (Partial) n=1 Tax=Frankia alni (strain DSM 45986 / CECT 9034 / ACN14a) TaxID=326424 RepID=Q0RHC1_FRAAA|nr:MULTISPECIES: ovoperoxidase [Frankia]CAJ63108.1 putative ovoperoxidase (partial) [Frankia alni ACN14a]